jgi:hypothetical protein
LAKGCMGNQASVQLCLLRALVILIKPDKLVRVLMHYKIYSSYTVVPFQI